MVAKVVVVEATVAVVTKAMDAVNSKITHVRTRTTLLCKPANNKPSVILHGIVGPMELVPIQAISAGNRHKVIAITQLS